MKLKMTVEEALEFADEWSRGMTIHEGSQGWRVVCMLLAEEVRRRVGNGGELIAARRERDELAAAIRQTLDENGHLADGDVCTLKVLKDALSKVGAGDTAVQGDMLLTANVELTGAERASPAKRLG